MLGALFIDGDKGSVGGDDTRLEAQINDALLLFSRSLPICDECFRGKVVDDMETWGYGGAPKSKRNLVLQFCSQLFPFKTAVQSTASLDALFDLSAAYTTNFSPLKTGGRFFGACTTSSSSETSKNTETSVTAGCRARFRLRITCRNGAD